MEIRENRERIVMKILVDADACPVKEAIVREAKKRAVPVVMILDNSHLLQDGYSEIVTVDQGADSADFKLISLLSPGDLVVTQDFGVAAMALGKGASAVNQNGLIFTADNIDRLLFERHIGKELRRSGRRSGKTRGRTKEDDAAFIRALVHLLDEPARLGKEPWA
jgi:hypothetical protein